MTLRRLALATTLIFLASGCSDQTELKAARDRISKLEAELAAERAKTLSAPAPPPAEKVTSTARPSEPAPEPKPEPSGQQWTYDVREDKMTGGATRHAYVLSTNTVNSVLHTPVRSMAGFPYASTQNTDGTSYSQLNVASSSADHMKTAIFSFDLTKENRNGSQQ
ncbi:MAG: hypothetical protein V5B34_17785 [Accumulibacter sp.]